MNTTLSVLLLLLLNEQQDSPAYRLVVYICMHLWELENTSLSTVLEACYCSQSSAQKLIRKVGAPNWSSFKERLILSEKNRKMQLIEKFQKLSQEEILNRIESLSNEPVDRTKLVGQTEAFAKLLMEKKRMNLFGSVFPLVLSLSFAEDLCVLGIFVCPFHADDREALHMYKDQFNTAVTLSGRWLESRPETFQELRSLSSPFGVISTQKSVCEQSKADILLPATSSVETDNCIYLLVMDLILLSICKKMSLIK